MGKEKTPERGIRTHLENVGAIILASLLFAGSHPNIPFANGLPLLAWIAYVPVFWVVRRSGFAASVLYGAFYGYASYGLYNYWLSVFHPLAGLIVGSIYMVFLALLFPLLRLAIVLFPRRGYLLQWLIWLAYEYLCTQGFLGYSYGVTAYSQWNLIPLIQIADIAGVWIVSALVVFPSAWLAAALSQDLSQSAQGTQGVGFLSFVFSLSSEIKNKIKAFFLREPISAAAWLLFLLFTLVYGFASPLDYSGARTVRIAMIQHNTDPWAPSHAPTAWQTLEEYRRDFLILRRLSDEAIRAHPDTDMVVWSETAFVPRIYWHSTYRDDPGSWQLVRELLEYLGSQEIPFLIGNDDARRDPAINPDPRENHRIDYNAAMLYDRGELVSFYRKLHLVPFTEHFPYQRQLPWVYQALRNADTHFWEKGSEATVLESRGLRFSTPICFEDTFGYISREFVRNGAEVIVNISNDAWSRSLPAQMQHLGMAVFRSVENRRSMVRSTSSGQTCAIDPNGRIIAMAEPFSEAWLSVEIPVETSRNSLYTKYGDFLGLFFTWLAIILLLVGLLSYIMEKRRLAA